MELESSELLLSLLSLLESEPAFSAASASARSSWYFRSSICRGASAMNALRSTVIGPRPIIVKKLTANRALATLSFGNRPPVYAFTSSSSNFLANFSTPRFSEMSCINILMNILLADVVSSSFNWIARIQFQPMLSVCSKWLKNLAAFRSLLTSRR